MSCRVVLVPRAFKGASPLALFPTPWLSSLSCTSTHRSPTSLHSIDRLGPGAMAEDAQGNEDAQGSRRRRIRNAKQQELNRLAQQRYR
jgi:hypothetical protein